MVANGLKVPQTSTTCLSLTVINTVLWLVSNRSLVAEIWQLQVLVVGYVHVSACISMYLEVFYRHVHKCSCIFMYLEVYTVICRYMSVYVGITGKRRYVSISRYCMYMYVL